MRHSQSHWLIPACLVLLACPALAQVGGPQEPLRYVGPYNINWDRQDGGLPPVVGVQNIQVLRSNRSHPQWSDGLGWTYHHAAVMCYWNDKFYLVNKTNLIDEDIGSGQLLLYTSPDGMHWSFPRPIFPLYAKGEANNVGLRMPYYVSKDNRLLCIVSYGSNGMCVREINRDDSFGPIHSIFADTSKTIPHFKQSTDAGFVAACDDFLQDDLIMPFWWEMLRNSKHYSFKLSVPTDDEVRSWDLPYRNPSVNNFGKGATIFHRKDGAAVILWKFGLASMSRDEGESWSKPVKLPTLKTRMQMIHAQRTEDGRYALLFDPDPGSPSYERRYPLVAITSNDGISFDHMGVIHGEVPDQRYEGRSKEAGPSYVRGIAEGQGDPPGSDMWVSYTVSKENVWVARIPVPLRLSVDQPVADTFDDLQPAGPVTNWNIYSPSWARVSLVQDYPGSPGLNLELRDKDPADYAKAVRVFPVSKKVQARFNLMAEQTDTGSLHIEIHNATGSRTARVFLEDGIIWARNDEQAVALAAYYAHDWMTITIDLDVTARSYTVSVNTVNGQTTSGTLRCPDGPPDVERITFHTDEVRLLGHARERAAGDLPGTDEPDPEAVFHIDDLTIK
ncbi:MAG: hypothetical protein IT445_13880 [Phycisphaeraceae bacterium]|nr:hypothetical protein [Phycisphaeraceae bacterium]